MRTCQHKVRVSTVERVVQPVPGVSPGVAVLVERCVHCTAAREVRVRFELREDEHRHVLGVETVTRDTE
jgi:hypothetical protein